MTRALEKELRSKSRSRLRSSTLRGAGRLLDLGGTYREETVQAVLDRRKARAAQGNAVENAWRRVGQYLSKAMQQFEAEHTGHE